MNKKDLNKCIELMIKLGYTYYKELAYCVLLDESISINLNNSIGYYLIYFNEKELNEIVFNDYNNFEKYMNINNV